MPLQKKQRHINQENQVLFIFQQWLCYIIDIHNRPLAYTSGQWVAVYGNWHKRHPISLATVYANWHTQQQGQWAVVYANWHTQQSGQWVVVYANWHTQWANGCDVMYANWHTQLVNGWAGLLCMPMGCYVCQLAYTTTHQHTQQPIEWPIVYAIWHTPQPIGMVAVYANGLLCMPIGIQRNPLGCCLLCMPVSIRNNPLACCVCQLGYTIARPMAYNVYQLAYTLGQWMDCCVC